MEEPAIDTLSKISMLLDVREFSIVEIECLVSVSNEEMDELISETLVSIAFDIISFALSVCFFRFAFELSRDCEIIVIEFCCRKPVVSVVPLQQ